MITLIEYKLVLSGNIRVPTPSSHAGFSFLFFSFTYLALRRDREVGYKNEKQLIKNCKLQMKSVLSS